MQEKMLYLIRGIPGSGKSTLAETLAKSLPAAHVEADMYFTIATGKYVWDPERVHASHQWCQQIARKHMTLGHPLIVSNTSTREKEVKVYIDLAAEFGYSVTSIIVENRREGKSIHGVSDETLEKMKHRFSIKL